MCGAYMESWLNLSPHSFTVMLPCLKFMNSWAFTYLNSIGKKSIQKGLTKEIPSNISCIYTPIFLPLSVPDMSNIFQLVWCQLNPIIPIDLHHLKDLLDLIYEILGILTSLRSKELSRIYPNKVTDPSCCWSTIWIYMILNPLIVHVSDTWANIWITFVNSTLETSWYGTRGTVFAFLTFALLVLDLQRGMIWNVEHWVRMELDHTLRTIRVTR